MTPTARALKDLRAMGFDAQVVEKWIPQVKRRVDLFGCIDILAMRDGIGTLGVQACAGASHAARRTKAMAEPRLRTWLGVGNRFEVWSYAKRGARGQRKLWELRRDEVRMEDLSLS